MRKLFLFLTLLIPTISFSQTLSGKTKSNKEELIGVTIWLTNKDTNKKGRFLGQFLVQLEEGELVAPITENLYINII